MAIIDLQRRITEAGRIRTGIQVAAGNSTRPEKLDTFRFTSADQRRIEQIAALYGGKAEPWEAPAGAQWQVISERKELEIMLPPSDLSFSQHYELWSAGGCQRRCDGVTESITEGPCKCNPEDRECDIHTRLSVLLRDIPGLGVWRLDTQGWYAAHELSGATELIAVTAGRGALVPARIRLDQRSVKRPDKNGKVVTRRFSVPVIDIEITPAQLLAGGQGQPLQIAAGDPRPPLTPVPMIAAPVPSIAEQSAPPAERPKRANAAAEIPSSGRRRAATAATVEPPAAEPVVEEPAKPKRSPKPAAPAEPEAEPLSNAEFKQRIHDGGIDIDLIAEKHRHHFPNGPSTRDMDDHQRGRLWLSLTRTPALETPAASASDSEQPTAQEPGPVTPPAGPGLSLAELTEVLQQGQIGFPFAEAKAQELFAERLLDKLTDRQRYQVVDALDLIATAEEA